MCVYIYIYIYVIRKFMRKRIRHLFLDVQHSVGARGVAEREGEERRRDVVPVLEPAFLPVAVQT